MASVKICELCGSPLKKIRSPQPPDPEAVANAKVAGLCFLIGAFLGYQTGENFHSFGVGLIATFVYWFGVQCVWILLWRVLGGNEEKAAYQAAREEQPRSRSWHCPKCGGVEIVRKAQNSIPNKISNNILNEILNEISKTKISKTKIIQLRSTTLEIKNDGNCTNYAGVSIKEVWEGEPPPFWTAQPDIPSETVSSVKNDAKATGGRRKFADQGHAEARDVLRSSSANGKSVVQDKAESQFRLGEMYSSRFQSRYESEDITEAIKWYRKAAGGGHAGAQYKLGMMYKKGKSVAKYEEKACEWFRKAADQGHADAQYELGVMEANGRK